MLSDNGDGTFSATINSRSFRFSKWGAEKTLLTFSELTHMASYGFADAARRLRDAGDEELSAEIVAMFIKGMAEGIGTDPQRTLRMVKRLACDDVFCDGEAVPQGLFDTFYRGDILFALEVVRANFEVQFQRFFTVAAPYLRVVRAKLESKNTSPSDLKT